MHVSPSSDVHPQAPVRLGMVLLALAMGGFAIGTTEFAAMSLLPYFAADMAIDKPAAGHAISAYALGVVIGAPLIAVMGARFPRKYLLLALMTAFAVGNLLSALAPNYPLMLLARFVSGMPHGAYFGVAALTAASLVPRNERAKAVARAMLGLTIATIIGVPLADQIGQLVGWRWGFALVVAIAVATVLMVQRYVPLDEPAAGKSGLRELRALKNRRVWLTLAISAIGFGGMFAVYTFLSSTLLQVTGVSGVVVSVVLGVFGVGMTIGTLVAAWAADRALMLTAGLILLWSAAALALYPVSTGSVWAVTGVVFCIGCGGGLGTVLQTRLMDVAGEAQTLAAALNHSAFNFANAMGPLLAGMALSHGYGLPSTGYVGCLLTLAGFAVWLLALWEDKYTCTPPCEEDVCLNG